MAPLPPTKRRRINQTKADIDADDTSAEKLSPVVVFAHGAGAPSSSDWMIRSLFYFFYATFISCILIYGSCWFQLCIYKKKKKKEYK